MIQVHIESAQPVSSKRVTERARLQSSPATVRHEMGILEDMGYLTHPHTSSGRIPTDQGYRYYVDHDFREVLLDSYYFESLKDDFLEASSDAGFLAEKISGTLSLLSEEAGLVVISDPPVEDFEKARRRRFFLQGSRYILEKPEFQDLEKVRGLFKTLEEKTGLIEMLAGKNSEQEVRIAIGRENRPEPLWDCSVVSAAYFAGDRNLGTLAIMGPKRMHYSHTVPLVREMARLIGSILEHNESEK
ncbi:MAG TPA: hypothetical protein VD913_01215 [bacterium]|nr:hypothetical protein [bacterium]